MFCLTANWIYVWITASGVHLFHEVVEILNYSLSLMVGRNLGKGTSVRRSIAGAHKLTVEGDKIRSTSVASVEVNDGVISDRYKSLKEYNVERGM